VPFEITPATREALDAWGACQPQAVFSGKAVAAPADTITGRLGQSLAARASRLAAARLGSNFSQHQNQPMRVDPDDPARPDVFALLEEHLRNMHELSPPESVHALDVTGLQSPEVTFWSVRDQDRLLGCGALKELDTEHGEVKSMRTPQSLRRSGAGRAVLKHIIEEARRRGYKRLSLETGSMEAFRPAWRLYESFGFQYCGPFADYKPDPNSVFMTLVL
jgi:putative acetyltransferase